MSLAVCLGDDRKCSAAAVGLDLVLGLSLEWRCSLNRSFKRRFALVHLMQKVKNEIGYCLRGKTSETVRQQTKIEIIDKLKGW